MNPILIHPDVARTIVQARQAELIDRAEARRQIRHLRRVRGHPLPAPAATPDSYVLGA